MTSRTALPANPLRSPERALPAHTRLDEFEIERVLAQSSFALVYRAYDHALRLHVAIKEYLPDALALRSAETQVVLRSRGHAERFDRGLQAFIAEAQTLARCDHPSLVRIVRVLQRHGTAYRVMRYTPGPTLLAQRREQGAAPDAATLRRWLDALLGALETLHDEGSVHGAVAPGNILLLHGGRPLLLDTDAVRTALISDRTQSMMAALEPCFEPPEQRAPGADGAMGPWTDLYSLVATLHFCIGGQLPAPPIGTLRFFEPLGELWRQLQATQPELGDAPAWLEVLDSCLADAPQSRPRSVGQVRGLLDALPEPRRPTAPRATPRMVPTAPEPMTAAAPPAVEASSVAVRPADAPVPVAADPSAHPPAPPPAAAPPPTALDPAHAKVMADLDQTFAFIAAQANEDAAAPAAASEPALQDLTAKGEDGAAADVGLSARQRLWLLGAVALVLVLAMAAAVVWMLKAYDPGLLGGSVLGAADAAWQPTSAQAAPVASTALVYPPPGAGPVEAAAMATGLAAAGAAAAATPPATAAPAAPAARVTPAQAPATPPAKTAATKAPAAASPREACGRRERYALLQCMQTQCARIAWSKHEQCVRLRKERKL
jgi:serine/threonine protein kinase